MTRRALITGGQGFVAQWAIRAMLDRGWSVTAAGLGAPEDGGPLDGERRAAVQWAMLDVTQQAQVREVVERSAPDVILHLAAISHVLDAMRDPGRTYAVNTVGAVYLLTEVARLRHTGTCDPTILVVGSAEQYGRHEPSEMPLDERASQRPLTLYAASKLSQEIAALQAHRSDGVRVVCTRSFSHSGPGQPVQFLLPALVSRALALPESGGTMAMGNGETVRDFLHVADVVEAYLALLELGRAGEVYNVSSGDGISVRALAESVLQRVGASAEISSDPALSRPVDVPVLIGNSAKLRGDTGWAPRHTREDIIDDLIHAATR